MFKDSVKMLQYREYLNTFKQVSSIAVTEAGSRSNLFAMMNTFYFRFGSAFEPFRTFRS